MIKLIKENKGYIAAVLAIALGGILLLQLIPKDQIHLFVNRNHGKSLDFLFKYGTWLGDGLFALFFCILLFFYKTRIAIVASLSVITSGLVVQVLKRVFFATMARPVAWFDESANLYLVEGVKLYHKYSFPSGHTTTAFALFTVVALGVKNNKICCPGTWNFSGIFQNVFESALFARCYRGYAHRYPFCFFLHVQHIKECFPESRSAFA